MYSPSGGRPSLYRSEEHCAIVHRVMSKGGSIAQVCTEIGVGRVALCEWRKKHPEFNEAIELGKEASQTYWEGFAHSLATGAASKHDVMKKSNVKILQFLMARRFPDYFQKTRNINEDVTAFRNQDELKALTTDERRTLINRYRVLIEQIEAIGDEESNDPSETINIR